MRAILFCVVILYFVGDTFGYCYIDTFQTSVCTAQNGDTIPAGGRLELPEKCERCTCSARGPNESILSCCGYGIHAGVFMPPEGCKVITGDDGCSMKLVQIADESLPC